MKFGFIAAWYDFWVGAFYDRKKKRLYVMPVPCLGFWVERGLIQHDYILEYLGNAPCDICGVKTVHKHVIIHGEAVDMPTGSRDNGGELDGG